MLKRRTFIKGQLNEETVHNWSVGREEEKVD